MEEDYVSFETAKLLKEKGFNEVCRAFWKEWDGQIMLCHCSSGHVFEWCHNSMLENYNDEEETNIAAPTLQMAMKWLREMHNIHIGDNITYTEDPEKFPPKYYVYVSDTKTGDTLIKKECCLAQKNLTPKSFDSPEEACEAAIKYCLENLI